MRHRRCRLFLYIEQHLEASHYQLAVGSAFPQQAFPLLPIAVFPAQPQGHLHFCKGLLAGAAAVPGIAEQRKGKPGQYALLPLYYVRYMETELAFLRNMPISLARRAAVFVCTYAIIFLPELLFLLWNERSVLPLQVTLSLYVVAVVRMCLYTALQYVKGMGTDRYTSVVLGLFFASLLLLASVDLWVFAVFESVAAIAIFYRCYPGYERMIRDSE